MGTSSARKLNLVQAPQVSRVAGCLSLGLGFLLQKKKNCELISQGPQVLDGLWEVLRISEHTPSWGLKWDESCSGDFIGDSDLIPLAHSNARQTAKNIRALGTVTPGGCGGWGRDGYPEHCLDSSCTLQLE